MTKVLKKALKEALLSDRYDARHILENRQIILPALSAYLSAPSQHCGLCGYLSDIINVRIGFLIDAYLLTNGYTIGTIGVYVAAYPFSFGEGQDRQVWYLRERDRPSEHLSNPRRREFVTALIDALLEIQADMKDYVR